MFIFSFRNFPAYFLRPTFPSLFPSLAPENSPLLCIEPAAPHVVPPQRQGVYTEATLAVLRYGGFDPHRRVDGRVLPDQFAFNGNFSILGPASRFARLAITLAQFSEKVQIGNFRKLMSGIDAPGPGVFFQAIESRPGNRRRDGDKR